jgi:transcriptional regulator with GAF, ATPase, and Fis domain
MRSEKVPPGSLTQRLIQLRSSCWVSSSVGCLSTANRAMNDCKPKILVVGERAGPLARSLQEKGFVVWLTKNQSDLSQMESVQFHLCLVDGVGHEELIRRIQVSFPTLTVLFAMPFHDEPGLSSSIAPNVAKAAEATMSRHSKVETLYAMEKAHILSALRFYGGNKSRAAAALDIDRATLYKKLREYGHFARNAG